MSVLADCEAWPEGLYGLPMPNTGCPHSDDVSFQTGEYLQPHTREAHTPGLLVMFGGLLGGFYEHVPIIHYGLIIIKIVV